VTVTERKWVKTFGNFELTIDRSFVFGKPSVGAGMVIHQGDGRFLLVGWGFQVTFKSTKANRRSRVFCIQKRRPLIRKATSGPPELLMVMRRGVVRFISCRVRSPIMLHVS
jgi:hypothetical protein